MAAGGIEHGEGLLPRARRGPCNRASHFMTDQEQQEGEMILAALSEAVRSRQREPMRKAMGDAGRFLLSARDGMCDGSHDPIICTRISSRIRTLEFAPAFNWL